MLFDRTVREGLPEEVIFKLICRRKMDFWARWIDHFLPRTTSAYQMELVYVKTLGND